MDLKHEDDVKYWKQPKKKDNLRSEHDHKNEDKSDIALNLAQLNTVCFKIYSNNFPPKCVPTLLRRLLNIR